MNSHSRRSPRSTSCSKTNHIGNDLAGSRSGISRFGIRHSGGRGDFHFVDNQTSFWDI